ncbi:uncharacterized protein [Amphiura filiformis]|uniref:uncharacterized protein n=1 Tax=Amphiura filiformis TaxID=82378 RepID=UPI003B2270E9
MPRAKSKHTPKRRYPKRSNRLQDGRSSDRLKKKSLREFVLPDKAEILANLVPEGTTSKNYRHLRPRKLISDYVKGRNRYNNPDGIDLFDDSPLSDFVDDEEEALRRRKRKKKRKESSGSSEWENSEDKEFSEGSAFSESDDVLDDTVQSDDIIDSEDDDGEPLVDVVSTSDKSTTDEESVSSTEEFMQKRVKKSLKKIPKRVTSSTWWKTNKKPLSESTRKRRKLKRCPDQEESDDSEEQHRPAKHKKRRSTISDDEDDDERPSCSSVRSKRGKAKTKERSKKRPKAKRTPVVEDEDDTDEEGECATPAVQEEKNSGESSSNENITKGGNKRSSSDEDDQSSTNENNGEAPRSEPGLAASVRRRKTRQSTVVSSGSETEVLDSSTENPKDGDGSSSGKNDVAVQRSGKHCGNEEEEEDVHGSQDHKSSSDGVSCVRSAEHHRTVNIVDDEGNENSQDSQDLDSSIEGNDTIDDTHQAGCESNETSKELESPRAVTTLQNGGERSQDKDSDLGTGKNIECSMPISKDNESNEVEPRSGLSQTEHTGDKSDVAESICQEVSDDTGKEGDVERRAQGVIDNEADKTFSEVVIGDTNKGTDEECGIVDKSRVETQEDTGEDNLKTDVNDDIVNGRTSDVVAGEKTADAVADGTENVSKAADDYDSDDSIVECPVPPKTPPPEITLSSDEEEPEPASTNIATGMTSNYNPATAFPGSGASLRGFGPGPLFGNGINNPFQQTFGATTTTVSATNNMAAALSRSGASMNNNPFGQVLNSGYMMGLNAANPLQQVGPRNRMSTAVSNNQVHSFPNQDNNSIQRPSLFNRSNTGNDPNQQQTGQNKTWSNWPQVSCDSFYQSAQEQHRSVNSIGYQSGQRSTMMAGHQSAHQSGRSMMSGTSAVGHQSGHRMTTMSGMSTSGHRMTMMSAGTSSGHQSGQRMTMMSAGTSSGHQSGQRMSMMSGTSTSGHQSGQRMSMMSGTSTSGYQSGQRMTTMSGTSTSGTLENPQSIQDMNTRVASIRRQLLSGHSWGVTPNTVRQNSAQTWGKTPNTTGNFQSSRLPSQMIRSNNNNQRSQQPPRLEILGVSNNRISNPRNDQDRNILQSSRNCVQPSSFSHRVGAGNAQTEQRTNFSGNNPFGMGGNSSHHQQSYTPSNNQLPSRTPMQNDYQTSRSGYSGFGTTGFGRSTEHSTANSHPQAGYSNFGTDGNGSTNNCNPNRFPGARTNGVVSQTFPGTAPHVNSPAADRLKMFANSIPPTSIQQQQQQQNASQSSAMNNVTFDTRLNKWVHVQPGSGSIQQQSFSSAFNQSTQSAASPIVNSIRSSSSAVTLPAIRPSSFQSNTMNRGSGQMQQDVQQPIVTRSIPTNPPVNTPNFGNVNNVQIYHAGAHGQNPPVNLPVSASHASNTFQQVGSTTRSMGHFVQEAYEHLDNSRKNFDRSMNNIQDNIKAIRNIQEEMRSMTARSSSTKEIAVFSQTIISEVSSVQTSSEGPSSENALPDIHNLQPSQDGLDPVGGSMLTDINDAVLASIANEEPVTTESDDMVIFTLDDDPTNKSLATIGDEPLITLGDETDSSILHSYEHMSSAGVMGSSFNETGGGSAASFAQSLTSSGERRVANRMDNLGEQLTGTPVVILRDILSQIKSVRFDQPSGQSLRLGRAEDRRLDICPGKKFLIKEKSDDGEVDIIDQSTNAIIVLETNRARLTEKAKRICVSKSQDDGKQTSSVATPGLDKNNASRTIGQHQENYYSGSVLNTSSVEDSISSHSSRNSNCTSSSNYVGPNERFNTQTASNNNGGGVKLHPTPSVSGNEDNPNKSVLDILPVV